MAEPLPYFEPSGAGLLADLKQLEISNMVSMGWYRGQVRYLAPQLFGYDWVNGIRCYGWKCNIDKNVKYPTNTGHAGRVQRWLRLFGVEEEDHKELYDTYKNDGVQHVRFIWKEQLEYEEGDFEFIYDRFKSDLSGVGAKRIELEYEAVVYGKNVAPSQRVPRIASDYSSPKSLGESEVRHDFELRVFNSSDVDVTSSLSANAQWALKSMLYMLNDRLMQFDSVTKTGERVSTIDTEYGIYDHYRVTQRENYTYSGLAKAEDIYPYFDLDEYDVLNQHEDDYSDNGIGDYIPANQSSEVYGAGIWKYRSELTADETGRSNALFQFDKGTWYLSEQGLKEVNNNDLGYLLPRYAYIDINKRSGGGFLGIGGFLGDFLGGLVGAFIKLISLGAKIMTYLPVMRAFHQMMIFMLTGKWISNREELQLYIEKIAYAAITVLITWFSGGSGTPAWLTMLSYILAGASLIYNLSKVDEELEARREGEKSQAEKEQKDKTIDDMMEANRKVDDLTFMPLDKDYRDAGYDVFGDQNEFQINYGMEGDMLYQL